MLCKHFVSFPSCFWEGRSRVWGQSIYGLSYQAREVFGPMSTQKEQRNAARCLIWWTQGISTQRQHVLYQPPLSTHHGATSGEWLVIPSPPPLTSLIGHAGISTNRSPDGRGNVSSIPHLRHHGGAVCEAGRKLISILKTYLILTISRPYDHDLALSTRQVVTSTHFG